MRAGGAGGSEPRRRGGRGGTRSKRGSRRGPALPAPPCFALLLLLAFPSACNDSPTQDGAWFVEEARARGLVFEQRSGHDEKFWMPEIPCGFQGPPESQGPINMR